jgi:cytochrome P450
MPSLLHLNTPDFVNHAHRHFVRLRAEEPVCRVKLAGWNTAYLITRYDDVLEVMKDPRVFKNSARAKAGGSGGFWLPKNMRPLLKNMLSTDEPATTAFAGTHFAWTGSTSTMAKCGRDTTEFILSEAKDTAGNGRSPTA